MSRKRQKPAVRSRNQAVANVAPITADSGPLHTSAEALRYIRQNKHNPLPYLKPEMLSRALESFEHGRIREAVLLWEKMAERDDMISSVKPKREKDVSQLDMQVVVEPDSGQAGLEHRAVLQRFWKTCRAVNSYDRNERGGFRRLIKQMMTATSFRYAAHHIIWDPRPDGELRATFEFVPLWLFENTTGKLRYLKSMSAITGEELDDSEWMVTVGDGLMIACSIGYLAKRSAFNDWLIFSEKFSVPGVLGRTSAKADTAEALAMAEAVRAFGHDWCSLITGDDGTHAKPIEIIQAAGNPAGMPMPAVIERVDRRMAALYRGADLSSMSSGQHSKGAGASLQEKETEILLRDDAETLAETLAEVSRLVIEWHFGNGVEPLARVELVVPIQEDSNQIVTSATQLADRGAKVSASALMERLNLPAAKDGVDALQPMAKGPAPAMPAVAVPGGLESLHNSAVDTGMQGLRKALAADLQPLGDALYGAYQQQDFSAMRAALRKISADMPELAGDADHLSSLLAEEMASAYLGDGSEDVENSDRGNPVGYFFAGGMRRPIFPSSSGTPLSPKGMSQPMNLSRQTGSIRAAMTAATAKEQGQAFSMGRVDDELAKRILAATEAHGEPRDITGMEWRIDSDFVAHARKFHPNLTDDDFLGIPGIIAKSPVILPGTNDRGLPTVNFKLMRAKRDYLLVGAQFNKQGQISLNTFKKSAEGKAL